MTPWPPPHAGQAHGHDPPGSAAGDRDAGGGGETDAATGLRAGWSGPSRSRQHADGLWLIATEWLAGTDARAGAKTGADDRAVPAGDAPVTARRARPQLVVHVSLAEATATVAGHIDLAARGPLPRLTAAAVEALVCSGDVQAVVVDGARPLATTPKVTAATIPTATRQAVEARDRGCRWPGCSAPLAHTEIHHLLPQRDGGTHHPDNLVCLYRSDHLQAHGHGWTLTLEPATGALTGWRHHRRRWTTDPAATPLANPTNDGQRNTDIDPPDSRDPPDDPPGTDHHGNPLPF